METIKEKIIFIVTMILTIVIFLSPIAICLVTGNWWYMFLFWASWIPATVIGVIGLLATALFETTGLLK